MCLTAGSPRRLQEVPVPGPGLRSMTVRVGHENSDAAVAPRDRCWEASYTAPLVNRSTRDCYNRWPRFNHRTDHHQPRQMMRTGIRTRIMRVALASWTTSWMGRTRRGQSQTATSAASWILWLCSSSKASSKSTNTSTTPQRLRQSRAKPRGSISLCG